jgi:demethylmenaquinone methyltransferase/2-methoxy-6-polyprenyl-1,4-benzoquinol methylase
MKKHPLQAYYSRIYRTYDLVNALFTLGMDRRWRHITVQQCLATSPQKILDLCCGTGDLAITLSHAVNNRVPVVGYDMNPDMLNVAKKKAVKKSATVEWVQGDAGAMPFNDREFDSITIGFGFRNLTWENPARDKHISEIARVMKPGASMFILESARPANGFIRFFYKLYLKTVLVPLGGLLSGDWNAYRYLAGSSAGFYTFNDLQHLLNRFGLGLEMKQKFLFGAANLLIAKRI